MFSNKTFTNFAPTSIHPSAGRIFQKVIDGYSHGAVSTPPPKKKKTMQSRALIKLGTV